LHVCLAPGSAAALLALPLSARPLVRGITFASGSSAMLAGVMAASLALAFVTPVLPVCQRFRGVSQECHAHQGAHGSASRPGSCQQTSESVEPLAIHDHALCRHSRVARRARAVSSCHRTRCILTGDR
jgi:hypothetical protein